MPLIPRLLREMLHDQSLSLEDHDDSQSDMMEEMCLVVDGQDNMTGIISKLDCHHLDGHRHRAFSVFLFDPKGRLLVQRRSPEKITFPGVWGNTCCSHPLNIEGENGDAVSGVINAAKRKLEHELGIPSSSTDNWDFQHIGILEYWHIDILTYTHIDILARWHICIWAYWHTGILA